MVPKSGPIDWIVAHAGHLLVLVATAAIFWVAYDDGSYGLSSRTTLAIVVWWILILGIVLRLLELPSSFRQLLPAALLGTFAAWTLISVTWSASAEATFDEFNRVTLYLGILILASLVRSPPARERLVDALTLAVTGIALVALCQPPLSRCAARAKPRGLSPGGGYPSEFSTRLLERARDLRRAWHPVAASCEHACESPGHARGSSRRPPDRRLCDLPRVVARRGRHRHRRCRMLRGAHSAPLDCCLRRSSRGHRYGRLSGRPARSAAVGERTTRPVPPRTTKGEVPPLLIALLCIGAGAVFVAGAGLVGSRRLRLPGSACGHGGCRRRPGRRDRPRTPGAAVRRVQSASAAVTCRQRFRKGAPDQREREWTMAVLDLGVR